MRCVPRRSGSKFPTSQLTIDADATFQNTVRITGTHNFDEATFRVIGEEVVLDQSSIVTRQDAAIEIEGRRNLFLNGSELATESGGISLSGNRTEMQATAAVDGIRMVNSRVSSGSGDVLLTGRGGIADSDLLRGIVLFDNSTIETVSGNITLEGEGGTGGTGDEGMRGIQLGDSGIEIKSADGDIFLNGKGGSGLGGFHQGIIVFSASIKATNSGAITLLGEGGTNGRSNLGVALFRADSSISSVDGAIDITGIGGNAAGDFGIGIQLLNASSIRATGLGEISLRGTAGQGDENNHGVNVSNSEITSATGALSVVGVGGSGTGEFNMGVRVTDGAKIESQGTEEAPAPLSMNGTAGRGTSRNFGVSIAAESEVRSRFGDLSVVGTGGDGTAVFNIGIRLLDSVLIESTSTGPNAADVLLNGFGGSGTQSNRGIESTGTPSNISTNEGDISLIGVGSEIGSFSHGVVFFAGNVTSRGDGDILFDGTTTSAMGVSLRGGSLIDSPQAGNLTVKAVSGSANDFVAEADSGLRAGTGDFSISADSIDITEAGVFSGAGALLIEPTSLGTTMAFSTSGGTLNLSFTETFQVRGRF